MSDAPTEACLFCSIVAGDVPAVDDDDEGLWLDGAPARLCPTSGRFLPTPDQAMT